MIKCRFHHVGLFYNTIIGLVWRLSKSVFLCGGFGRRTFCVLGENMNEKLVYEIKYPHSEPVKKPVQISETPSTSSYYGILASEHYTIIPERHSRSEEFIKEAIRISQLYRISTRIVRHYERISVHLAFDFSHDLRDINRLFGMADNISFLKDQGDRDIAADLDFYTHVVVKNGMSIAP